MRGRKGELAEERAKEVVARQLKFQGITSVAESENQGKHSQGPRSSFAYGQEAGEEKGQGCAIGTIALSKTRGKRLQKKKDDWRPQPSSTLGSPGRERQQLVSRPKTPLSGGFGNYAKGDKNTTRRSVIQRKQARWE